MRFGVFLVSGRFPGQRDSDVLRRSVRAAELAEEAGFDDVWFAEHHFMPYGVCPSAITLAAHVLGRTSRIGVGTAVSVLSTTHPVALAEQWAMLDAVSGAGPRGLRHRAGPLRNRLRRDPRRHLQSSDRPGERQRRALHLPRSAAGADPGTAAGRRRRVRGPKSDAVRQAAARNLPLLHGLHADDEPCPHG